MDLLLKIIDLPKIIKIIFNKQLCWIISIVGIVLIFFRNRSFIPSELNFFVNFYIHWIIIVVLFGMVALLVMEFSRIKIFLYQCCYSFIIKRKIEKLNSEEKRIFNYFIFNKDKIGEFCISNSSNQEVSLIVTKLWKQGLLTDTKNGTTVSSEVEKIYISKLKKSK